MVNTLPYMLWIVYFECPDCGTLMWHPYGTWANEGLDRMGFGVCRHCARSFSYSLFFCHIDSRWPE